MFNVIETTSHYAQRPTKVGNRWVKRGDVIRRDRRTVFASEDVLATCRYRFDNAPNGYQVSHSSAATVTLTTEQDGTDIDFADIFTFIEGQEAFDAVMNHPDPAFGLVESSWVAEKTWAA